MVSHTISAFSGKPIFGQSGPLNLFLLKDLTQQTICRKFKKSIRTITALKNENTENVSNLLNDSFRVKIFQLLNNPQITKARSYSFLNFKSVIINFCRLSMLVGISEAICLLSNHRKNIFTKQLINYDLYKSISTKSVNSYSKKKSEQDQKDLAFNEWLAGLIDGDGCFQLSKKGYASLEIVVDIRDKHCLYLVKQKFGGAVKLRQGANHLRYRLHHKAGILSLINSVNGLIRNPVRVLQLSRILAQYNLKIIYAQPLTYNNGWLAGFFDSDGSIYINETSGQLFITCTQKNKFLLDILVELYGGQIYTMEKQNAFKWTVFRKAEILSLVNNYFKAYPSRSEKHIRLKMVSKFYELRQLHAHKATSVDSVLNKTWKHFIIKWTEVVRKGSEPFKS